MSDDSAEQKLPIIADVWLRAQDAVRAVWGTLLEMVLEGGPSTHSDKGGKLSWAVDRDCLLFPLCVPGNGRRWMRIGNSTVSEYADFRRIAFWKTLERPHIHQMVRCGEG